MDDHKDIWAEIERRAHEDTVDRTADLLAVFVAGGAEGEEARRMLAEVLGALGERGYWMTFATLMRGMGNGEDDILRHIAGCHATNRRPISEFYRAVRKSGIVPTDAAFVEALTKVDEAAEGSDGLHDSPV